MLTPDMRAKIDRVVESGNVAEAKYLLGSDCDRLLAERASELLAQVGTHRATAREGECWDCKQKLDRPKDSTRCVRCRERRGIKL